MRSTPVGKPDSPKLEWETKTSYVEAGRIAIIMVGLPARGKSFVARNLARYLRWIGVKTKVVSLTNVRRSLVGDNVRASFFDPNNKEALEKRTEIADKALNELIRGFDVGGTQVGILDASNTIEERRSYIQQVLFELGIKVIFLECIYGHEEEDLVANHIAELRISCPEYEKSSDEDAVADFKQRVQFYRPDYVTMDMGKDQEISYIQLYHGGDRIVVNQIYGFLRSKILFYLMNLRHAKRNIFLCQPSDSIDCDLLRTLVKKNGKHLVVWSDVSDASLKVCGHFNCCNVRPRATLRRLDAGKTEGYSEAEIKETYPEDYKRYCLDPYHHRYSRAESYHDLVVRLESIIMELERDTRSILIIADASVLRCIYAYYIEASPFIIPSLVLDPSELVLIQPEAYGSHETRFSLTNGTITFGKTFRTYG